MIYPDERVAEVCQLGPVKAEELLTKARAGDLNALADWTVRAAYRHLISLGANSKAALFHTRGLLREIELKPMSSL